jgi:hypothetical protein
MLTLAACSGWNPARYQTEIPIFARGSPYDANFKFDSHQDCAASITQCAAQDVFYLMQDVNDIRRHKVKCAFLKAVPNSHDATAQESLRRLLTGESQLGLAFPLLPSDGEDRDHWRARQIPLDDWINVGGR